MFSELVGGIRFLLLFALQVNRDVLMAGLSHLLPSGSQIVTLNLSNVDVARSQGLDELAMQKAWWGDWGTWGANRWASLVDMHLAATSRVVVGTYGSTFSELVGALNVDGNAPLTTPGLEATPGLEKSVWLFRPDADDCARADPDWPVPRFLSGPRYEDAKSHAARCASSTSLHHQRGRHHREHPDGGGGDDRIDDATTRRESNTKKRPKKPETWGSRACADPASPEALSGRPMTPRPDRDFLPNWWEQVSRISLLLDDTDGSTRLPEELHLHCPSEQDTDDHSYNQSLIYALNLDLAPPCFSPSRHNVSDDGHQCFVPGVLLEAKMNADAMEAAREKREQAEVRLGACCFDFWSVCDLTPRRHDRAGVAQARCGALG